MKLLGKNSYMHRQYVCLYLTTNLVVSLPHIQTKKKADLQPSDPYSTLSCGQPVKPGITQHEHGGGAGVGAGRLSQLPPQGFSPSGVAVSTVPV